MICNSEEEIYDAISSSSKNLIQNDNQQEEQTISDSVIENKENLENEVGQDIQVSAAVIKKNFVLHEHNYANSTFKSFNPANKFKEICNISQSVILPENWKVHCSNEYVTFFEFIVKNCGDDKSTTIIKKSLNITKNLNISYSLFGKLVSLKTIQLAQQIESFDDFQMIVQKFLSTNVCCGLSTLDDNILIQSSGSSQAYTDLLGIVRHSDCDLLISSKRCDKCLRLSNTIFVRKFRKSKYKNEKVNFKSGCNSIDVLKKKNVLQKL